MQLCDKTLYINISIYIICKQNGFTEESALAQSIKASEIYKRVWNTLGMLCKCVSIECHFKLVWQPSHFLSVYLRYPFIYLWYIHIHIYTYIDIAWYIYSLLMMVIFL